MIGRISVTAFLLLAGCSSATADRPSDGHDFRTHFEQAGVTGTLVLYDVNTGSMRFHNEERAHQRFIPASTFKIPHSLIALEMEAVADTSEVAAWDGTERSIESWNADHSMTSAFRHSVVWFYQNTARRIGEEAMRDHLVRLGYGNASVGGGIDRFWLTGDLRISAVEQINFLLDLYRGELPYRPGVQRAVREMMLDRSGESYRIHAKTGLAERGDEPDLGWYVGYVERESGDDVLFAMNMDVERPEHIALRREITLAILRDAGVIEPGT